MDGSPWFSYCMYVYCISSVWILTILHPSPCLYNTPLSNIFTCLCAYFPDRNVRCLNPLGNSSEYNAGNIAYHALSMIPAETSDWPDPIISRCWFQTKLYTYDSFDTNKVQNKYLYLFTYISLLFVLKHTVEISKKDKYCKKVNKKIELTTRITHLNVNKWQKYITDSGDVYICIGIYYSGFWYLYIYEFCNLGGGVVIVCVY